MNEITPSGGASASPSQLVETFLAGLAPRTRRKYELGLRMFAGFVGQADSASAMRLVVERGQGWTNLQAHGWRAAMLSEGLSPSTVNARLSALRQAVKLARSLGLVSFGVDAKGVRSDSYRDTSGPGRDVYLAMLDAARNSPRDAAILRLLHDLGLRRGEVVSLDLGDWRPSDGVLSVMGKGRREAVLLTVPEPTGRALDGWVANRGSDEGPLFLNRFGGRLTGEGVRRLVAKYGLAVGVEVRPHGLRHTAITEAASRLGFLAASAFGRHADPRVTKRYIDNLADVGGEAAREIAPE